MHKDTLEELRKLASEKEWLTAVAVTQSVEDAIKMAEKEYRSPGKHNMIRCRASGSQGDYPDIPRRQSVLWDIIAP